jgi:GAF domain-containing protein
MERQAGKGKGDARTGSARSAPRGSGTLASAHALGDRLAEVIAQRDALADILRVIAASPTDLAPMAEAIAEHAARLCRAPFARVIVAEGDTLRAIGQYVAAGDPMDAMRPIPVGRGTVTGRAMVERRTIHLADVTPLIPTEFPDTRENWEQVRYRAVLAVPLLGKEEARGAIFLWRREPRLFSDDEVALVETFARQAALAIDNVRQFHETREALEQQSATSELLAVIGRAAVDVQPVFETLVRSAVRLCTAERGLVFRYDGAALRLAVGHNLSEELRRYFEAHPLVPSRVSTSGRAALERRTIHIHDVLHDPDYAYGGTQVDPYRTVLAVPMMRGEELLGVITIYRHEVRPFVASQIALMENFAQQAVIAIENVRLFTALEARNAALSEALEQKTATGEILRVIAASPTDIQPVFDLVAHRAGKLCSADVAVISRIDGGGIELAAIDGLVPKAVNMVRGLYPMAIDARSVTAQTIRSAEVVHVADVLAEHDYDLKDFAVAAGYRAGLGVPIIRHGHVIGSIFVGRSAPGLFSPSEASLLKTFADQAVIAIENVRLFNELEARNAALSEALEQQTATSEILRVISATQVDPQPVFDAIVRSAVRLCDAQHSLIFRFDGSSLLPVAQHAVSPSFEKYWREHPLPPGRGSIAGRSVADRRTVHVHDVLAEPGYEHREAQKLQSYRTVLAVPMVRDHQVAGVIVTWRQRVDPFTPKQISLVETFAEQAMIAIENVRLFTQLESRNAALTESLEQQTATSEILRVISSSPTDVQPVFDTIAAAALQLCAANTAMVATYDGALIHTAAVASTTPGGADAVRAIFPRPPSLDNGTTRAIHTRRTVMIADVVTDPDFATTEVSLASGFRSVLAVPLRRGDEPIGAITVGRPFAGPFPEKQVALLQTFADQAVIAIENVRLFRELAARTAQLTRSVGELKALGEVGQAVSSTLDLGTVLRTIVARARELAGMDGGSIYEYDEEAGEFHLHAADRLPAELVEALRSARMRKGEGALGRMADTGKAVQIHDIADTAEYQSRVRDLLVKLGYRSLLAVPLRREDRLLGGLVVNRARTGEFAPEVIALLETFAAQSALAIQNARLYREVEEKSRQLETASRHKSEFLANMSHELRTPLNAIIGFSDVLSQRLFGEINERQAEYLGDIMESGQHLLALINDVLDLSKIEAGRMELDPAEFDLRRAIEATLALVRERAQRREIALGCHIAPEIGTIHADERKVKQVLLNLLSNALKFTPEGGQVDVRARVAGGFAQLSVTDTGVGIAPADQEAVFEEFRQVGASSKKAEGTGLGLAISRKFVELHGGTIGVTSVPGRGSTFTFTLPLR